MIPHFTLCRASRARVIRIRSYRGRLITDSAFSAGAYMPARKIAIFTAAVAIPVPSKFYEISLSLSVSLSLSLSLPFYVP